MNDEVYCADVLSLCVKAYVITVKSQLANYVWLKGLVS